MEGFHETIRSDGSVIWTDKRYQDSGAQVLLRSGDPPVHAYHIEYDQWRRMVDAGILGKYDSCELLEGVIVGMPYPEDPRFGHVRHVLVNWLNERLPADRCALHNPWLTLGTSEPMAEVAVFRGSLDDLLKLKRFANGSEVSLVVEVGRKAREMDRVIKGRIYAAAGIPEYWIVNLVDRRLEVYRRPTTGSAEAPARYESVEEFGPDRSINVVLDGATLGPIVVGDLLP